MNEFKELRKPAKRKGATRMIISGFKRNIYFIDLMDFSSKQDKWIQEVLRKRTSGFYKNRGYKYVLVCIDGYSRYLMTRKLKSKSATEVTHAMKDIIQTYGAPKHICADRGTEFENSIFRTNILDKYGITMYHMNSSNKAVLAERAIRDIKEDIMVAFNQSKGVWFDLIDGAVRRHNARRNRTTGYSPNDIWHNNILYMEQTEPTGLTPKDTTPQFKVGDYVRVTRRPRILEKRSLTIKWSNDLYEVVDIDDHIMPIMYEVSNVDSNSKQKCYHWELLASKCKPEPEPVQTRSQARNQTRSEPNALREAARSHRPVTRSSTSSGATRSRNSRSVSKK